MRNSRSEVVDDPLEGVGLDREHVADPHPPQDMTREGHRDVEKPTSCSRVGSSGNVDLKKRRASVVLSRLRGKTRLELTK